MGLHQRYAAWLGDHEQPLLLAKEKEEEIRKQLSSLFDGMMKVLFRQQGSQFSVDILADDKVQNFIEAHAGVLDSAFEKVEMSDSMRRRLTRSNYIFSGMKTFHELNEAFPSIVDENGERKSFERFLNDVRRIDKTYNSNYLRAEYNFVVSSATMAAKWEEFMEDGDRYNLQYRTAKDDKGRPEHAALDGVTLPPSDSFWAEYYPPNGWNCRCTVVQVRKSKYPQTSHDDAMALGEEALQRDTKGIFHFNPGQEQKTFPDYNPYTIRRCNDCEVAKGKATLSRVFIPDFELCRGCEMIHECYQKREKANAANLRDISPEDKHNIYSSPIDEQFSDCVYTDKSGHTVRRHTLKDVKAMDYKRVLDSAKLLAEDADVKILPEIHFSEVEIRTRLGLQGTKNPDLIVGTDFVDIKSPFDVRNIVRNANSACSQNSIACITDHLCLLDENKIRIYARAVFMDKNYTKDKLYFIINNKLYIITTADI